MAAKTTKKTSTKTSAPKNATTRTPVKTATVIRSSSPKRVVTRKSATSTIVLEKKTADERKPSQSSMSSLSANLPQMQVRKSTVLIGLAVVVLIFLLYLLRGLFVVATVNGQPISRLSVVRELERTYGKQQINTDISKTLIMQEASRRHIEVNKTDIDTDVKNVEKQLSAQGQKLDDVLTQQGMTRNQWLEGEKIRVVLQKMFAKDTAVTDKDIDAYIVQNKSSLPDDAATNKATRQNIKDQLTQQKLSAKIQSFLADQQKKAKIHYIVNY